MYKRTEDLVKTGCKKRLKHKHESSFDCYFYFFFNLDIIAMKILSRPPLKT